MDIEQFHKSIISGNLDYLRSEMLKGFDLNLQDALNNYPLIVACLENHIYIADLLISAGSDVNIENSEKKTPLIVASILGNFDLVELLTFSGSSINQQDLDGKTALMFAIIQGHLPLVPFLMNCGSDLELEDNAGYTALDYSMKYIPPEKLKEIFSDDNKPFLVKGQNKLENGDLDAIPPQPQLQADVATNTKEMINQVVKGSNISQEELSNSNLDKITKEIDKGKTDFTECSHEFPKPETSAPSSTPSSSDSTDVKTSPESSTDKSIQEEFSDAPQNENQSKTLDKDTSRENIHDNQRSQGQVGLKRAENWESAETQERSESEESTKNEEPSKSPDQAAPPPSDGPTLTNDLGDAQTEIDAQSPKATPDGEPPKESQDSFSSTQDKSSDVVAQTAQQADYQFGSGENQSSGSSTYDINHPENKGEEGKQNEGDMKLSHRGDESQAEQSNKNQASQIVRGSKEDQESTLNYVKRKHLTQRDENLNEFISDPTSEDHPKPQGQGQPQHHSPESSPQGEVEKGRDGPASENSQNSSSSQEELEKGPPSDRFAGNQTSKDGSPPTSRKIQGEGPDAITTRTASKSAGFSEKIESSEAFKIKKSDSPEDASDANEYSEIRTVDKRVDENIVGESSTDVIKEDDAMGVKSTSSSNTTPEEEAVFRVSGSKKEQESDTSPNLLKKIGISDDDALKDDTMTVSSLPSASVSVTSDDQVPIDNVQEDQTAPKESESTSPKQDAEKSPQETKITDVDRKDKHGKTLLFQASEKGDLAEINNLLRMGASMDHKDFKGNSPLMAAASKGHTEGCKLLISHSAQILDAKNAAGLTALALATQGNHPAAMNVMINEGANINIMVKGQDLLMLASEKGAIKSIKVLLLLGFNPYKKNFRGQTAVDVARKAKQRRALKFFATLKERKAKKSKKG